MYSAGQVCRLFETCVEWLFNETELHCFWLSLDNHYNQPAAVASTSDSSGDFRSKSSTYRAEEARVLMFDESAFITTKVRGNVVH